MGIVAGYGNEITPEFDAAVTRFCVGTNGHAITHTISGGNILFSGVAFALGYAAYFENVPFAFADGKWYYVHYVINHSENLHDMVDIVEYSSYHEPTKDDIANEDGVYDIFIARVEDGEVIYTYTDDNNVDVTEKIEYPQYAKYADEATGRLADGVTAVTQPSSDNSNKVATTAFVQSLTGETTATVLMFGGTESSANLTIHKKANIVWVNVHGTRSVTRGTAADYWSVGDIVCNIPNGYRPNGTYLETTIVLKQFGSEQAAKVLWCTINTNGNVEVTAAAQTGTLPLEPSMILIYTFAFSYDIS